MSEREKNEIQQETTRERPGFIIYFEEALIWDKFLDDHELAQLFRAVIYYAKEHKEPEGMPRHLMLLYQQMRGKIQRDQQKYDRACEKKKEAALVREAKKKVRESQNRNAENIDNTRKNEREDTTTVQNSDTSSQLSQKALTETVTETVTVTPTQTVYVSKTSSSSYTEILTTWERTWRKTPTAKEAEGLLKIVNEGYELEDIHEALRIAHQNADDNPVGYMIKTLKDWKENGRPKRPRESRDIMQRYSQEERQATYSTAELNFDDE